MLPASAHEQDAAQAPRPVRASAVTARLISADMAAAAAASDDDGAKARGDDHGESESDLDDQLVARAVAIVPDGFVASHGQRLLTEAVVKYVVKRLAAIGADAAFSDAFEDIDEVGTFILNRPTKLIGVHCKGLISMVTGCRSLKATRATLVLFVRFVAAVSSLNILFAVGAARSYIGRAGCLSCSIYLVSKRRGLDPMFSFASFCCHWNPLHTRCAAADEYSLSGLVSEVMSRLQ